MKAFYLGTLALLALSCGSAHETSRPSVLDSIIISGGDYKIISGDPMGGKCTQSIRPIYNGKDLKKLRIRFSGSCNQFGVIRFNCKNNDCSALVGTKKYSVTLLDNLHYRFIRQSSGLVSKLKFAGTSTAECTGLKGGDWVAVPANKNLGQNKSFCVMKYEAKQVGGKVHSQAALSPWVQINRTSAASQCAKLGTGYRLISNVHWQTIARNIETARDRNGRYLNWQGGTVSGNSAINRGHSNGRAVLAATGPDKGAWSINKRTHELSNGSVIWDLAGNAWEWVSDNNTAAQGQQQYISVSTTNFKDKWLPAGNYRNKSNGEFGGLGYGNLRHSAGAIFRGGDFNNGTETGIFAVWLGDRANATGTDLGFRCVYTKT